MDYLSEQGLGYLSNGVNVGDTLTYSRRYSDERVFTKVTGVTKTTVKCDNGTVWTIRTGKQRGSSSSWRPTYTYVVRDAAKVAALAAERDLLKKEKAERDGLASSLPSLVRDMTKEELAVIVDVVNGIKQRNAVAFLANHFANWARM